MFWVAFFMCLLMVYALGSWLPKLMIQAGYSLGASMLFLFALNIGGMVGAIGGGGAAYFIAKKAQNAAIKATVGEKEAARQEAEMAEATKARPMPTMVGEFVGATPAMFAGGGVTRDVHLGIALVYDVGTKFGQTVDHAIDRVFISRNK